MYGAPIMLACTTIMRRRVLWVQTPLKASPTTAGASPRRGPFSPSRVCATSRPVRPSVGVSIAGIVSAAS